MTGSITWVVMADLWRRARFQFIPVKPSDPGSFRKGTVSFNAVTSTLRLWRRRTPLRREKIDRLVRKLFGAKSEKLDPAQLLLAANREWHGRTGTQRAQKAEGMEMEPFTRRVSGWLERFPAPLPSLRSLRSFAVIPIAGFRITPARLGGAGKSPGARGGSPCLRWSRTPPPRSLCLPARRVHEIAHDDPLAGPRPHARSLGQGSEASRWTRGGMRVVSRPDTTRRTAGSESARSSVKRCPSGRLH